MVCVCGRGWNIEVMELDGGYDTNMWHVAFDGVDRKILWCVPSCHCSVPKGHHGTISSFLCPLQHRINIFADCFKMRVPPGFDKRRIGYGREGSSFHGEQPL